MYVFRMINMGKFVYLVLIIIYQYRENKKESEGGDKDEQIQETFRGNKRLLFIFITSKKDCIYLCSNFN